MKKKQLKEELELANATLDLSMVALRKLDEVLQEAKAQGFVPKNLNNKTEPQAGDKIVQCDIPIPLHLDSSKIGYPDYVCIKNYGVYEKGNILSFFGQLPTGEVLYFSNEMPHIKVELGYCATRPRYFKIYQLKKETPLSDLNKEVQEELENKSAHDYRAKNDLSCNQPETTKDESYLIQAKEAVDKFMPFVNEWKECDSNDKDVLLSKTDDPEVYKRPYNWKYKNKRDAAINCAIQHFELIQKQGGWLTHIDCVQIIKELQKMLAQ